MDTILVSSGYHAPTLEMLRRDWRVIDIPNQTDAWIYLTQCDQLPMAIAIGYVRHPDHYATAENLKIRLPAHVMLQRLQKLDPDLPVVILSLIHI